jgi:hypothetical protein
MSAQGKGPGVLGEFRESVAGVKGG